MTRRRRLLIRKALVPILFSYGGWQVANYVAEEMRNPEKHLPRSLIIGTLTVVAIYLLVNVAYCARSASCRSRRPRRRPPMPPRDGLATPADASWRGDATSAFGFLNLAVLAPTRVLRDGG